MTDRQPVRSILAADIGTTVTHVGLIERVEGVYRLVASAERPTTLVGEEEDVCIGLERAVHHLESVAVRRLWGYEAPIVPESAVLAERAGVDAIVASCSVAPALSVVIIGITDQLSVDSARRACEAANVRLERCVALGTQFRNWDDELLSHLYERPPDVIVLVGGSDAGPVAPLESAASVLITLYEHTDPEGRPVIVFAGNLEARRSLSGLLDPLFDYRVVDNVRPNVHVESLGELKRELSRLYEEVGLPRVPGYRRLSEWLTMPLRSTHEALGATLRFLARRAPGGQGVLGLDAGGLTTHVAAARGDAYQWAICADTGTSYGLSGVLDHAGAERLQGWLPMDMALDEVTSRLHNARLRPHSVAQSRDDLLLLHAALRESAILGMRRLHQQWGQGEDLPEEYITPAFDLLAARGGVLTRSGADSLAALSLLDSVQPVGLSRAVLDWAAIWPQLSVLAALEPLAALQVLDRDAFRPLGTVIAPLGEPRGDEPALYVVMTLDTGKVREIEVPAGTIVRVPLRVEEEATIEVQPSRTYDLGVGRRGVGGRARVQGGGLGLIFDTRGRPLRLPEDPERRRELLVRWLRNLEGDGDGSA